MFKLDDSDSLTNSDGDNQEQDIQYTQVENITNSRATLNTPWIEKYRPRKVEDLVLNKNVLVRIKKIIENKNMPNIILTGVPGVGKTSTVLCIAKNLLGKYFSEGVIELNASDERGIKSVHENIEYFCKKQLEFNNPNNYSKHKIVILDEADNMTKKAQQTINILMETYKNTRFAFTCNSSSDILEAIQSRCIILRYERLTNIQVMDKLKHICDLENVPYEDDGINALVSISQGDLRQAINILQLIHNGYVNITYENVYKLCDKPAPLIIKKILLACKNKNVKIALTLLHDLRSKGYSSSDVTANIIGLLKDNNFQELSEEEKIKYMQEFSKTYIIISKGLNTNMQLTGCICGIIKNN